MLGQPASSQTVCRPSRLTSALSSLYSGPIFSLVLIHGGLRSIGVSALRTSRRSSLRPLGIPAARRSRTVSTLTSTMLAPDGRRGRRATASATGSATSSTVMRRPSSAVSDVTPASEMPHGTIDENADEVAVTVEREAVQRGRPRHPDADRGDLAGRPRRRRPGTHTPDRPSTRPVARPRLAHTAISESSRRRTNFTTSSGCGQADDRIADQLAGAVPGDLAAAVGVDDGVSPSTGRSCGSVRLPAV